MSENQLNYEQILRIYEKDAQLTVNRIEKSLACEAGGNYMSHVSRVNVFGMKNDKDYNKRLIIKELPLDDQHSQLYRSQLALKNETYAYNILIPALSAHYSGSLPFPECIYAGPEGIVLKDLCEEGFLAVGTKNGGLSLEQCEIVLDELAKLHAASFVMRYKEPKKFSFIFSLVKEILFHESDSELLQYQTQYLKKVHGILKKNSSSSSGSDHNEEATHLIRDIRNNSRVKIRNLLLNPQPEFSVICHGDCWAGNIMFNGNKELRLIDVQQMRYNSVATDIDYLLYSNLSPEVHYRNRERLLDSYLMSLCKNVKCQGVNMDHFLTRGWLDSELRRCTLYGFIWGMWIMPVFFMRQNGSEMIRETSASSDNNRNYEKRLKKYILEYVKRI